MRIAVAVTNDLVTDQRVARACQTLMEAGHSVTLIGRLLPDSMPVSRPYATHRMRLLFRKGPLFYAEYNIRLFCYLLTHGFDMAYANDTDTLMACYLGGRLRGIRVFYDAHEMFAEVPELVGRPLVRRMWETIEGCIVPRVDGAVTVCQSIADIYSRRFGIAFGVVRNVPDGYTAAAQVEKLVPPVILYQGAVNIGRGIDRLIDAMEYLPDYRFLVVGVGDEYESMRRYAAGKAWHERIEFRGRMEPAELRMLTPQASLGVCLLDNLGLNYYYSLPNRIGDFIAAGVPMLATRFPEIARVVEGYGIGYLVDDESGAALAQRISDAVTHWQSLSPEERDARMAAARADLSWNNDSRHLVAAVERCFNKH